MRTLQRYALVFWAFAILLIVGGQTAHAFVAEKDVHCQSQHSESTPGHPAIPDDGSDPEAHHCCHWHHPGNFLTANAIDSIRPNLSGGHLPVAAFFVPGALPREIDYPPQWS